ncbi:MAG: ATP-binding protein [Castellaniella sp.]|uniref:ATP-binding protein n=1 Tax=Castellaniella sp. TaxID=1955812 RepID=UPI003C719A9E
MKFLIHDVRCNIEGYDRIARLSSDLKPLWFEQIELDFSGCEWFDANMSAPLGVVLALAADRINDVRLMNLRPGVESILSRNRFLLGYGYQERTDAYGSTLPYRRLQPDDARYFSAYVDANLERQRIPRMSDGLSRRFKDSILEIFDNAAVHSETELGIFVCGQYFHKRHKLDFSIADAGIGIRRKIANELGLKMPSHDAIAWALETGNTTRQGKIPGGMGLKIMREFIEINRGRLQIVSDRGYWEQCDDGKLVHRRMDDSFPGTVINIEINTADERSYRLSSEI